MSPLHLLATLDLSPDGSGAEEGPPPDLPAAPGSRAIESLSDALTRNIDSPVIEMLVKGLLEPSVRIAMILIVASVVVAVLRKLIGRGVARAKDPDAARGTGFKRRVGLMSDDTAAFSLRRAQRADALGALLSSIVGVVIYVLAVFMVLAEFGVNLAPLVAGAGVVGLAVGFGAQDLVKDFLSGVFMLAEDQYGVGDIVDVGEAAGTVEGVTLRTTRIRDIEGTLWHVPNGEIRRVGNSSQEWARSLLDVGVAYDTDVDLAIEVIDEVAKRMATEEEFAELFLDAPAVWGVQSLGADSVDIRLVIKTQPGTQWGISRELRRRLKAALDAAGIEIPYPQRTVWFRNDDEQPEVGSDGQRVAAAVAASVRGSRPSADVASQDEAADAEELSTQVLDEAADGEGR